MNPVTTRATTLLVWTTTFLLLTGCGSGPSYVPQPPSTEPPAQPADTTAPTAPGLPEVTEVTTNGAAVSWPAAIDDRRVEHYEVFVNQTWTAQPSANSARLSGLAPDTAYVVNVVAVDAAGNRSAPSASARFRTAREPEPPPLPTAQPDDVTPPPVPGNVRVGRVTRTSIEVMWSPSTDDRAGVLEYELLLNGVSRPGAVSTPTALLSGLERDTEYTFAVRARDRAGNRSAFSPPRKIRTAAPFAVLVRGTDFVHVPENKCDYHGFAHFHRGADFRPGSPEAALGFDVVIADEGNEHDHTRATRWWIDVPAGGRYRLLLTYALPVDNPSVLVRMNGHAVPVDGSTTHFRSTGGREAAFQQENDFGVVELLAGRNAFDLVSLGQGAATFPIISRLKFVEE